MPLLKDFKTATHFGGVEDSSDKKKTSGYLFCKEFIGYKFWKRLPDI